MFEYRPESNQWVKVGDVDESRYLHAAHTIDVEHLDCLAPGGTFNMENKKNGIRDACSTADIIDCLQMVLPLVLF